MDPDAVLGRIVRKTDAKTLITMRQPLHRASDFERFKPEH
jgi:hypothetical protein